MLYRDVYNIMYIYITYTFYRIDLFTVAHFFSSIPPQFTSMHLNHDLSSAVVRVLWQILHSVLIQATGKKFSIRNNDATYFSKRIFTIFHLSTGNEYTVTKNIIMSRNNAKRIRSMKITWYNYEYGLHHYFGIANVESRRSEGCRYCILRCFLLTVVGLIGAVLNIAAVGSDEFVRSSGTIHAGPPLNSHIRHHYSTNHNKTPLPRPTLSLDCYQHTFINDIQSC